MKKVHEGTASALEGVLFDGMTIMCGGFGLSGNPETLIAAIREHGVRDLTVIANNCGADGLGLWVLLDNNQIRKMVSSYVGENKLFETLYLSKRLELELNPQGTLAERIRAGGAGIPAFYTRTGVGTVIAEGKPTEVFDGETYVRETWLKADLAIVNTCTVTTDGDKGSRKAIRHAARENPDGFLVVTGCYASVDPRAVSEIDGVDLVVSNDDKDSVSESEVDRSCVTRPVQRNRNSPSAKRPVPDPVMRARCPSARSGSLAAIAPLRTSTCARPRLPDRTSVAGRPVRPFR